MKRAKLQQRSSAGDEDGNYSSKSYWEKRHASGEDRQHRFEWFLAYNDVEPILKEIIDYSESDTLVVDVGCGTSSFLADLKAAGFMGKCLGIDYSEAAVETCRSSFPGVQFEQSDASKFEAVLGEERASVVIEKSLIDTILHHKDGEARVGAVLDSVLRAIDLRGGHLLSITQLDPRKKKDAAFLERVILPHLATRLESVQVHVSKRKVSKKGPPVPTVISYKIGTPGNTVDMDIVEYEVE